MKVAICFAGRINTWRSNIDNTLNILRTTFKNYSIDYFVSIHGDPTDNEPNEFI